MYVPDFPWSQLHPAEIHIGLFFSLSGQSSCQMLYLPWQNFTWPFNREEWQQRTACKWKGYFFIIFTWLVSQYIHSVVAAVGRYRNSRNKWKSRPLLMPWKLKGTISLFLLIFGLFSFFWSPHLIKSRIFADAADAVQSIDGWRQMKLSLRWFHSRGILYHPRWRTKLIWFYCQRKLQISLCFLKVSNGWQVVTVEGTYIKKV